MLSPSAVRPPSAKKRACVPSTMARMTTAAQGPTRTAASTPPSRWPLIPGITGKLNICGSEQERGHQARQRHRAIEQALARVAHGDGHGSGAREAKPGGGRPCDEAVGYVHPAYCNGRSSSRVLRRGAGRRRSVVGESAVYRGLDVHSDYAFDPRQAVTAVVGPRQPVDERPPAMLYGNGAAPHAEAH